jgi:hypothetical protein
VIRLLPLTQLRGTSPGDLILFIVRRTLLIEGIPPVSSSRQPPNPFCILSQIWAENRVRPYPPCNNGIPGRQSPFDPTPLSMGLVCRNAWLWFARPPPGPSTWSISTGYNRRVKMDQQLLIPETPSPVAPTPTSPKDVKKENSTTTRPSSHGQRQNEN